MLDDGAVFSGPHRAAVSGGRAGVTCPRSFTGSALKPRYRHGVHQTYACLLREEVSLSQRVLPPL